MKRVLFYVSLLSISLTAVSCHDDDNNSDEINHGKKELSEDYYTGGKL